MRNDLNLGRSAVELKSGRATANALVQQLARLRQERAQEAEDALLMMDPRQRAAFIISAAKGISKSQPATPRFGVTYEVRCGPHVLRLGHPVSFRGALVSVDDLLGRAYEEERAA